MQQDIDDHRVEMQRKNARYIVRLALFLQGKKRVESVGRRSEYFVRVNVEKDRVGGQDDQVSR